MTLLTLRNVIAVLVLLSLAAGCGSVPEHPSSSKNTTSAKPAHKQIPDDVQDGAPPRAFDFHKVEDAKPKYEPYSKYGNPSSYVVFNKRYYTKTSAVGYKETGIASWYGTKFHGRRTSSGEPYDMYAMTAAHKTLPLPTYAKVTHLDNKKSIIVKINDRGPFHSDRIIDLSYAAAAKLGFANSGTARVQIEAITFPQHTQASSKLAKVNEKSRHYIQVGAFINRHSAERLYSQLKTLHSSARITNETSEARTLFRVRLGPFENHEEATQLASAVDDIGLKSLIITK